MDTGIQERLNEFIRRKGLRRTGQRDTIVKAAFSKDEHFTAEELFDRARKLDAETSRATVYRTLGLLVEADLLREIDLGDNQTTYDPELPRQALAQPPRLHRLRPGGGVRGLASRLLNDCVTRRLGFKPVRQSIKIEANCEQLRLKGRCPNLIATRLTGKRLRKKR